MANFTDLAPGARRAVAVAILCVAAACAAYVAQGDHTRSASTDSTTRSAPPAAPVAPPDQLQWETLRGGSVLQPTTMAPIGAPRILQGLVPQYRAAGKRRVFRARPFGYRPRAIVLHGTGGGAPGSGFSTVEELQRFFARPAAAASAHFAIGRQGQIMRIVAEDAAAFHVARPGWNDISIGIELLNDNSGVDSFSPAQLRATSHLVRWLGSSYGIPIEGVVRHRTIQPEDRSDPAGNFPWRGWLRTLD